MSTRALAWARIALGLVFSLRHTSLVSRLPGIHLPPEHALAGWPEGAAAHRIAVFPELLLSNGAVSALCIVRTIAGLCFVLGAFTRPAGIVAVAAAYAIVAQDPIGFLFTTHIMYLGILVLALGDAGSTLALRPVPARSPLSSVHVARAFVASVYFWSAIPKLRGAWLSGSVLRAYFDLGYGRGALGSFLLGAHARESAMLTVAVEASLPVLLLVPRTRLVGVLIACMMHATFELTVRPDVLGWVMVSLLLVFLEPERLSRRGSRAGP